MAEVRQAARQSGFPEPVFIHRASVEAAARFFAARAPDARRLADPDGGWFAACGLPRGSWWQLLGPRVWWHGLRALWKGHGVGRPIGDVAQLAGAFLVCDGAVVWQHRARHSGELPDLGAMMAVLERRRAAADPQLVTRTIAATEGMSSTIANNR